MLLASHDYDILYLEIRADGKCGQMPALPVHGAKCQELILVPGGDGIEEFSLEPQEQSCANRLHVVFHVKHDVRLAMNKCRNIVSLLWSEAVGLILGHVVLHESRHFGNLIHARAVAERIRSPKRRGDGKFPGAIRAMADGALFLEYLASLRGISIQFRKIDEAAAGEWMAGHLIFGKPLNVRD